MEKIILGILKRSLESLLIIIIIIICITFLSLPLILAHYFNNVLYIYGYLIIVPLFIGILWYYFEDH